jgi:eukaryotic-like serine/threonine-protein kinase
MVDRSSQPAVEALLDGALALPAAEREDWLRAACRDDAGLLARLRGLLRHAERDDGFLDRSPVALPGEATSPLHRPGSLVAGQRFGAFALVHRLGAGGMGEVWLGERVEGGFEQRVAIKCLHAESAANVARFDAERAILAGLEHPGIARLYDGGVTADGRPYMVMEYVEGEDLLSWCEHHAATLEQRLSLFLDACVAVAHAHTHLVIHRDLKPANILVTAEGRLKLVDFGIAKLLRDEAIADATMTGHLSLAYAAPEQLTGGRVTTATDVHALGATLYQLLCGELPWRVAEMPLGLAIQRLLTAPPVPPSRVSHTGHPVAARQLRGDLDAIVAKALRAEPGARYPDARSLAEDIRRHLRHEPVQAQSGARLYVTGRLLRRHWLSMTVGASLILVLSVGLVGIAWQAQRAEAEAARATAIKDYLLQVFQASDPRIAAERPRGEITARELLDIATNRIDEEFADRPELRSELLGLSAGIYRELGENERYLALRERYMELLRALHGELHPGLLEARLGASDDAVLRHDYAEALRVLDELDPLLRRARLDDTAVRAKWWLRRGNALEDDPGRWEERMTALLEAARLFEQTDPDDSDYVVALANIAGAHWESGKADGASNARDWLLRAVTASEGSRQRNDGDLLTMYANLGQMQLALGEPAGADAAFERATELARMTYGEDDRRYWHASAAWAAAIHARGDRVAAVRRFENVRTRLPAVPAMAEQDIVGLVLTMHGAALVREGRPHAAIELLEEAERGYLRAQRGHRLSYLNRALGEAYEGAGRIEEARERLQRVLQELLTGSSPHYPGVLAARERWGRFLLLQGESEAAEQEFRTVIELAGEADALVTALAHTGLARLAIARDDGATATRESGQALALLETARPAEVRHAPYIWLVHARALQAAGTLVEAQSWAQRALQAFVQYNHPESALLIEARALHGQLAALPGASVSGSRH